MFQILHFEKPIPFMRYARPGVVFYPADGDLLFFLFDRGLNWGLTSPVVPPSRWVSSSR